METILHFERTVGDEIQGVLNSAQSVIEAAFTALRMGNWHIGIGVGKISLPMPENTREAGGTAFIAARGAVERAKKSGNRVPLAVAGSENAADAEAVLVLIGALVTDRSESEWRVLDLISPGVRGGQTAAAATLGISPQAVSKAVRRSGWQEEWAARPAAEYLLQRAETESRES
ncbi:hypothetical protein JOE65_001430 [Arthrobacter roseus]|nr:hypothetical protein [Arthrobacter roseus]